MFLNFYGLKVQPFGVTPDPEFLYLGATHREALASAAYGIQAGMGFGAVIAKPGMGKTTLLFALLQHFQNSAQSAFLFDTQCNSKDLLQNLLAEFKLQPENDKSDASALTCLRRFLLKSARANQRVLVVVDEAQNLDIPVFETLRLLSNFETPQAKLLHIVLAGQPELGKKLALPELEQLRQRITIVSRLDVFAPADIVRYVAHRLKRAGYRGGPLFTPEALGILVEKSHGIPREINRLCFNAMSLGCAMGKRLIDDQVLREAAADLEFGFVPKPEEVPRAIGTSSATIEGLAALFAAALEVAAPPLDEAERITREQTLQPIKSARPVVRESELRPQAAPKPVHVQPRAEREQTLQPTESASPVVRESERRPQVAPKSVPVQPKAEPEKPAASAAQASLDSTVPSAASGAAAASQDRVRNAFRASQPIVKDAPVAAHSRRSKRLGFRRFAWLWGLTLVAASVFGGLMWLSDLNSATSLVSQFISTTQQSVGQWLAFLGPVSAREKEEEDRPRLNSGDLESGLGASPAPKIKSNSTAATEHRSISAPSAALPAEVAPAVTTRNRNQKKLQTRLLNERAASPAKNVPATPDSAALAVIPAQNHFAVFGVMAGSGSAAAPTLASPVVNAGPNSPAPEKTLAAKLVKRVDPVYPQLASSSGVSGGVVLSAHIDEAGKVQAVNAISGDPELVRSAMDAVRQWEYQPSLVNGQPRQSDERIEINFSLR
jgi:general secretion pathway protein A